MVRADRPVDLYVCAHVDTVKNEQGRHGTGEQRKDEIPTPTGWRQAIALGRYITNCVLQQPVGEPAADVASSERSVLHVVSPTMARCQITAGAIAREIRRQLAAASGDEDDAMQRIRLRVEVDLRGIHLGSELTGLTTEEMTARYPEFAARLRAWQTHQEGYANQPPDIPGGEPTSAFVTRVAAALGRIVTAGTDRAVIVCPASTIQAVHGLLADQSGAPPEKLQYEAVQAPHGSVEVWRVSPDGFPVCQNGGFQIPPA